MKMQVTKEAIEQYEKDVTAAMRLNDSQTQLNELNEIEQMAEHYDWSNHVFIDEATGKKGLRGERKLFARRYLAIRHSA